MKVLREYVDFKDISVIVEDAETEVEGDKKKYFKLKGVFLQSETKNRNGRIYPKKILEREVIKYNEEKIKTNRAVGEMDHPECNLSKDFDVLTKEGWKSFENLKVGEEVLTLNDEGNIELNSIERIIVEPYKGYGYYVKGRNIDSAFTPNHRFLLKDRYGKLVYVTLEEIYNNRNKYNKHSIVKRGNWIGEDVENIVINGLSDEEYYSKKYWQFNNNVKEDLIIDTLTFVQFLGIWLAEGHYSKEKYIVKITQNKGEDCDKIEEMLNKFPIKWSKSYRSDKKVEFFVSDIRLWKYVSQLGDCYSKYIPYEIKQLDSIYLNELIEWFIMGDGRNQINEYSLISRRNLFSVSKKLIEDLHECLIKSGGCGNWQIIEPDKDYIFADHLIKAENKHTLYQLSISTSDAIYLDERFLKIEKVEHDGNVYCLTVKNSNFYMKENNKAFWTGNSPQINLDRISHVIESLIMENDDGVGVLRLIDTPMGKIAQTLVSEKILLGVSTRGVGSLDGDIVKEDYSLITPADLVFDPSAPKAFVESVLENKEWIREGDQWVSIAIDKLQKTVDKKYSNSKEVLNFLIKDFLNDIKHKI